MAPGRRVRSPEPAGTSRRLHAMVARLALKCQPSRLADCRPARAACWPRRAGWYALVALQARPCSVEANGPESLTPRVIGTLPSETQRAAALDDPGVCRRAWPTRVAHALDMVNACRLVRKMWEGRWWSSPDSRRTARVEGCAARLRWRGGLDLDACAAADRLLSSQGLGGQPGRSPQQAANVFLRARPR